MSSHSCNTLYYGDNLSVLREHIATASVDLVYLDPPHSIPIATITCSSKMSMARTPTPRSRPSKIPGIGMPRPSRRTTSW